MPVVISLLRGINVSGQKKIKMAELKALYEALGFERVTTYVQSGNVVFESGDDPATLAVRIREGIEDELGYAVSVMVRTLDEWRALVERNPYGKEAIENPKHLHVTLLDAPPDEGLLDAVREVEDSICDFHLDAQAIYLYCPEGFGRTKLSNNFWERKLKVAATTRNWNTMNKLLELAEAAQAG